MEKSLKLLEAISTECDCDYTEFAFRNSKYSEKYKKGRVSASKWINELFYHYIQKEKNFIYEFKAHLEEQKISISQLKEGDYKQGLFDQLSKIEMSLDKLIDKDTRS